ncbi:OmpA family protein [Candidatus Babeliales bacterium]|nr:OmpA family protein [Candidatus Babeliales bacterium]
MKKYLVLLLAMSFVMVGCKKKDSKIKSKDKTTKVAKSDDIPLMYNYEDAELFAENDVEILEEGMLPEGGTREIDEEITVATADDVEKGIDDLINLWAEELPENIIAEYNFKTIHFDINESGIRSDQEELLQENVETALNVIQDGKKLVIQGNCCQTGSQTWNMALSQNRAQKVADQLVERGIPADNIEVVAMGSENPVVWTEKDDRESLIAELAPNRRAELLVIS